MNYLNLGCGSRIHPDWINVDFAPGAPGVLAWDLARPIPLPNAHCQAVYHSHVLEHLRLRDALLFLRECRRVLVPGGVMRVVVPDLENLCRAYLAKLEQARAAGKDAAHDHEWMSIELLDQMVREHSGGGMQEYLQAPGLANEAFVRDRLGEEAAHILRPPQRTARRSRSMAARAALRGLRTGYEQIASTLLMGPTAARALAIGRFRLSGEAHQWMYDSHTLGRLLVSAGFSAPSIQTARSSLIADWPRFALDVTPQGDVVHPHSLYMEARA